jgi:hypothetical protein
MADDTQQHILFILQHKSITVPLIVEDNNYVRGNCGAAL